MGCRVQINLKFQSYSDYFPKYKEKWGKKTQKSFEVTVSMVLHWTKAKLYSVFFPRRDLQPLHNFPWQMGKQVSFSHSLIDYENTFATNQPTELFQQRCLSKASRRVMTEALLFHDYWLNSQKVPNTIRFKNVMEEAVQVTWETDYLKGDAESAEVAGPPSNEPLSPVKLERRRKRANFFRDHCCSPLPSFSLICFGNRLQLLKASSKTSVGIKGRDIQRSLPTTLTNVAFLCLLLLLILLCILHRLLFLNFKHVRTTLWLASHLYRASVQKMRQH